MIEIEVFDFGEVKPILIYNHFYKYYKPENNEKDSNYYWSPKSLRSVAAFKFAEVIRKNLYVEKDDFSFTLEALGTPLNTIEKCGTFKDWKSFYDSFEKDEVAVYAKKFMDRKTYLIDSKILFDIKMAAYKRANDLYKKRILKGEVNYKGNIDVVGFDDIFPIIKPRLFDKLVLPIIVNFLYSHTWIPNNFAENAEKLFEKNKNIFYYRIDQNDQCNNVLSLIPIKRSTYNQLVISKIYEYQILPDDIWNENERDYVDTILLRISSVNITDSLKYYALDLDRFLALLTTKNDEDVTIVIVGNTEEHDDLANKYLFEHIRYILGPAHNPEFPTMRFGYPIYALSWRELKSRLFLNKLLT